MKIQRTKNAVRSMVFDGLLKAFNVAVPFVMRSVMLHFLGVQCLGLNGLFRSILSVLNLTELGVGSVMVFSMYRPIAEDDTDTICALMKLYRTVYRVIGLLIAGMGLVLAPFLGRLVKGSVPPDMNLNILYFMNLGSTVLTYWLFAHRNCLLLAHQRNDVSGKIGLAVYLAEYTLKALALALFRNYYLYLSIQLAKQIAINLLTAWKASRLFPRYTPRGSLPKEQVRAIIRLVRDRFTAKVAYVVFKAADTLVISSFLGLTALAVYQNYNYVVTALGTMLEVVVGACVAGIGNSLVTESAEKNYHDLKKLSLLYHWMLAVAASMLLCLFQPFMRLWMGADNMLDFQGAVCFSVYFYCVSVHQLLGMFKDAAGIWRKDRWRPLAGAAVNLALNLVSVRRLGMYGVLVSSIVSIALVQVPWLLRNLFQEVFPRKALREYAGLFCGVGVTAVLACGLSGLLCGCFRAGPWLTLALNACVSFAVPNTVFLLVYGHHPLFRESLGQLKGIFVQKINPRA